MLRKLKGISATDLANRAKRFRGAGQSDEKYIIGLDIGTENVKALIGRITDDGAEIVGVGRARQKLLDMQAGAVSDIVGVVSNCDKALDEAEKQAGVSVRSAVIGIAGELVKGTTTTVKCTRKTPSKALDLAEVEKIINLVQDRAQKKAKQELAWELGGKDVEIRLVNSALVGMEIDGYPVTNPVGFQGKEVLVHLYTAFAPMIHIGALERVATELDLDLIAVAAEPFAVSRSVIGNDSNANMNAILMDMGGGTTDIAVVDDGGVQGTKMFGIGGRAFTRAIERGLGVPFESAEQLKLGLSSNRIAPQKRAAIEKVLGRTLDVWVSGIELALSEFNQLDQLPRRMLLCGGGSSLDMLVERLEDSDWYKKLPFARKPVIHHIKPSQVVGITDATGDVNDHTFITAMGLLRVGLDTTQTVQEAGSGTIRDAIDRMLRV
ncbi:hypothetical protein CR970_03395 [Candidatus Saccharibacteria bacterium]|nr:MAG: hypothetical protein CR970_03395 [Candidatus Saccharibacteria bacterium]